MRVKFILAFANSYPLSRSQCSALSALILTDVSHSLCQHSSVPVSVSASAQPSLSHRSAIALYINAHVFLLANSQIIASLLFCLTLHPSTTSLHYRVVVVFSRLISWLIASDLWFRAVVGIAEPSTTTWEASLALTAYRTDKRRERANTFTVHLQSIKLFSLHNTNS